MLTDHTDKQNKAAINLGDAYRAWIEAERAQQKGRLRWKTIRDTDYLYQMAPGSDTGISLGPRSAETEAQYEDARRLETIARTGKNELLVLGRIYRATRLPMIPVFAADVLRVLDRKDLLGSPLQVVGTNVLPAYELEASASVTQDLHATDDFDLSWLGDPVVPPPRLLDILREADPSWTVSMERTFQVLNRELQLIDVLVAPSKHAEYPTARQSMWQAIEVPGQEDLLGGVPVERVVTDTRGQPARIVAPDPRRFVLHKWLVSQEPTRKPNKRAKDRAQAEQVFELVEQKLSHYPWDESFLDTLSPRLLQAWDAIQAHRQRPSAPAPLRPRRPRGS